MEDSIFSPKLHKLTSCVVIRVINIIRDCTGLVMNINDAPSTQWHSLGELKITTYGCGCLSEDQPTYHAATIYSFVTFDMG